MEFHTVCCVVDVQMVPASRLFDTNVAVVREDLHSVGSILGDSGSPPSTVMLSTITKATADGLRTV